MLANEKLHPVFIPFSKLCLELLHGEVFASKREDQHTARVGVFGKGDKQFSCVSVVIAKLAASVRMRKCINALHSADGKICIILCQLFSNGIDTTYGGDDPYLVAHTGRAILAEITVKPGILGASKHVNIGRIRILGVLGDCCFYIVSMDMMTGMNITFDRADGEAVLNDSFPSVDICKCNFMSLGNVLPCGDTKYFFTLCNRDKRHCHIVGRTDFYCLHCRQFSISA